MSYTPSLSLVFRPPCSRAEREKKKLKYKLLFEIDAFVDRPTWDCLSNIPSFYLHPSIRVNLKRGGRNDLMDVRANKYVFCFHSNSLNLFLLYSLIIWLNDLSFMQTRRVFKRTRLHHIRPCSEPTDAGLQLDEERRTLTQIQKMHQQVFEYVSICLSVNLFCVSVQHHSASLCRNTTVHPVCVCVCVCVCALLSNKIDVLRQSKVCVCVCVCERARERWSGRARSENNSVSHGAGGRG